MVYHRGSCLAVIYARFNGNQTARLYQRHAHCLARQSNLCLAAGKDRLTYSGNSLVRVAVLYTAGAWLDSKSEYQNLWRMTKWKKRRLTARTDGHTYQPVIGGYCPITKQDYALALGWAHFLLLKRSGYNGKQKIKTLCTVHTKAS